MRALALGALASLTMAGAALAGDVTGLWATETDEGRVRIVRCGEGVCAQLVDAVHLRANPNQTDERNRDKSLRSRKLKGLQLFGPYVATGDQWKGGAMYDPKTGDQARSGSLRLINADTVVVKGCLGPLCRSETWRRVR